MGSSSGSDSESGSDHSGKGKEKKEKKPKEKKEKKDKEDKDKSSKDKDKSSSKDKDKKDKDKGKDKEKDKDKDKDKDKHKEGKESKVEIPGVGKIPGPAGALIGAALSGITGGKREAPPGPSHSGQAAHSEPGHTSYAAQTPGHIDPGQLPPYARLLNTSKTLPPPDDVGFAACTDVGGEPLFLILAPQDGGLHPGKMVIRGGSSNGEVYFTYGGREIPYSGDFALVPFDPQRMHWVPAPRGEIPAGVRPVEGGREADGTPLYFALGLVNGGRVPGKAGRHLGGASVAFGGAELKSDDSEVLCWS